jgi:GT2 family glycosyltransferase
VIQNRFEGRLGSARNSAVDRVTSDVIAFLDDDAIADPRWLEILLAAYRETGAVAVGGAPLPRYETERPSWFPSEFDWVFGCRYEGLPEERRPVRHLIGANMSVRAEALRQVGGFHSDNHDDMDMSHRIAATFGPSAVLFEPAALVYHFVPSERLTWRYFRRRCYSVNRGKVRAFADMAHAGNLEAELDFARQLLIRAGGRVRAGLAGDRSALKQAAAAMAGISFAAAGHGRGRVDLLLGRAPTSLTKGLDE